MRKGGFVLLSMALLMLAFGSAPVAASPQLYAAQGNQPGFSTTTPLYILDPNTGAILQTLGDTGETITGLDFHPLTRELYGTTTHSSPGNPDSLVKIDPLTGASTLIGPNGFNRPIVDITFASNGTLYGWMETTSGGAGNLVTIDLTTGAATKIGDYAGTYGGSYGNALDFAPDGKLYLFGAELGGVGYPAVVEIDPATGLRKSGSIIVAFSNFPADYVYRMNAGSHNSSGVLYAFLGEPDRDPRYLVTLNTTTGLITTQGAIYASELASPSALAWSIDRTPGVPALGTWGLLAFCLLLLGSAILVMRRRTAE